MYLSRTVCSLPPDFELQVSIVECLYRMTTDSARAVLAQKWFNNSPVGERFTSIREAEFEVVSLYILALTFVTFCINIYRTADCF